MKIISIGDTHGRNKWKEVASKESDFDRFIFVGDYFDSRERIHPLEQINNFLDILAFKELNKDKVTLLTGNHDFHYFSEIDAEYSSFEDGWKEDISKIIDPLRENGTLQMCYVHNDFIFTHAGLTKTWCARQNIDIEDLQNSVNNLFKDDIQKFNFTWGQNMSYTGDDVTQPPIWVRPYSLGEDKLDNYKQVVGHTTVNYISFPDDVILIDAIGTSGEYFTLIDDKMGVGKI